MRVLINGACLFRPRTGVGHTTANLHRTLEATFPDDTFWLYPGGLVGGVASRVMRGPTFRSSRTATIEDRGSGSIRGLVGTVVRQAARSVYRSHLQTSARWGQFDLYHEPNFVAVKTNLPTIITVHDLSVLTHPEWHPAERVRFHERHFRNGVNSAAHVIVVSETVRQEAMDVLGLPSEKVTAVHNGLDEQYRPQPLPVVNAYRERAALHERYFLAVGTIEPRKNLGTLMRAFCDLPAAIRQRCPLVLAGGWGWKSSADREFFENVAGPLGARHLGYVAHVDLPALYAGAATLLYPSHYEGFGLPPLEMLACGGSVIASTTPAVREVLGEQARYVEPRDLEGWREAMKRAAIEPPMEPNATGIAHAMSFSWARAAEQTRKVYRKVAGVISQGER